MNILRVQVQIVGLGADNKTMCWELYWKFWMMSDTNRLRLCLAARY